jgi:serine/threonine-protein kinase RsbW
VLATREPLVVDDVRKITLVSPVLQEQGLRSVVVVPIIAGDRVLGVLHAGSREVGHFTSADADLLGLLAERLAIAVDRVRLFEEQRHLADVATFLAETARIMAGASDLRATLEALAAAALPTLGDLCLIDMLDDGKLQRVVARHADPSRQFLANRLRDEFSPGANSRHPVAEVLRMGSSRWSPMMSDAFLLETTHDEEHYAITKELGFRSYLVVPIRAHNHSLGALTMVSCSRVLTPDDVSLAESLALQVGSVVAKAQELDQASLTSRLLQDALLPASLPEVPGLEIHECYAAASEALDVGGDFYDVIRLPNGHAWVAVGDVEGHDRRAAAVMGQLRSAARILAFERNDPAQAIATLRTAWDHLDLTRTASLLLGLIDPLTGRTMMASAGHLPPIAIGTDGASYLPIQPTPILGIEGDRRDATVFLLERGQTLLLYTDGAMRERQLGLDEGMAALLRTVREAADSPESICATVLEAVKGNDDDVALLAIRRT